MFGRATIRLGIGPHSSFIDITGFVSHMPLLYIPPCLSPKIWEMFSRVR